jgi:hypothetical protein
MTLLVFQAVLHIHHTYFGLDTQSAAAAAAAAAATTTLMIEAVLHVNITGLVFGCEPWPHDS